MKTLDSISATIISCRNILMGGRSNDNVLTCLAESKSNIGVISVKGTRKIIEMCFLEVIQQVNDSKFRSAGLILNLIHNLPMDDVSAEEWDIDYFLSTELYTFLEHFEEIICARKITLFVCEHISEICPTRKA